MRHIQHFSSLIPYFSFLILFASCSSTKYISTQSTQFILSDSNFTAAHVGISIYDPSSNKYLYTHQAEKYFIPASNTKLFTCYAAMKHLGDSLVGMRYLLTDFNKIYNLGDTAKDLVLLVRSTGDPSFLHEDYSNHYIYDFFKKTKYPIKFVLDNWQTNHWGNGWAWNDYSEDYMIERSSFPIYGNTIHVTTLKSDNPQFKTQTKFFDSIVNSYSLRTDTQLLRSFLRREIDRNGFQLNANPTKAIRINEKIPFVTDYFRSASEGVSFIQTLLLKDTLSSITFQRPVRKFENEWVTYSRPTNLNLSYNNFTSIHSQPTDSLLKPMMHRSDNFFAEQTLLMVSNEMTGVMNDAKIIDSLLKTDLKDLPQKPRWVDGSGLSRYNLFSPNDMVAVLNKMKNEFEWNRITTILPTGGEGTLSSYYLHLKDKIFAKTGTLSNNIALSGFLITKQNKTLIFSVLVNNHMGNTTQIRKAVEKFLTSVAEKY